MARMRLHRYLAASGVASRRKAEELIAKGVVSVDGVMVTKMGVIVDSEAQEIRCDDEIVELEQPAYYAVNKPKGYLCTNDDEYGRRKVVDLVRDRQHRRLYTVGRLDEESTGLIIVTNDGEFAQKISHPRNGVDKTYMLKLRGFLDNDSLDKARQGVWLSSGRVGTMYVQLVKRTKHYTHVRVIVREGKNRFLRRVFAKLGHAVLTLVRTKIGLISLTKLDKGKARRLTEAEVAGLLERCGTGPDAGRRAPASKFPQDGSRGEHPAARRGGSSRRTGGRPGSRKPAGSRGRSTSRPRSTAESKSRSGGSRTRSGSSSKGRSGPASRSGGGSGSRGRGTGAKGRGSSGGGGHKGGGGGKGGSRRS